jgi:hypothetical protein
MMEEKLINQLFTKIELIAQKLDILIQDKCNLHKTLIDDHETRLRILEENKSQHVGRSKLFDLAIAGIIAIITGIIVKVF